jgi:hypothetical protein
MPGERAGRFGIITVIGTGRRRLRRREAVMKNAM